MFSFYQFFYGKFIEKNTQKFTKGMPMFAITDEFEQKMFVNFEMSVYSLNNLSMTRCKGRAKGWPMVAWAISLFATTII